MDKLSLNPEIKISRNKIIAHGKIGAMFSDINIKIAEALKILSDMGSSTAPKWDSNFNLRAKYPSSQSVRLASIKITPNSKYL